jgi:hypothetical protein
MREFTKDELLEMGLPENAVEDRITGQSRWSTDHSIVFKADDGKHYRTHYSEGSTEEQSEGPWEYEDVIVCEEVHQVEKVVKVWESVEATASAN